MYNILNTNIIINKIDVACFVKDGTGQPIHKNRPSFGLAIHIGSEKIYKFDNVSLVVNNYDIIFLPKNSNYIVLSKTKSNGCCYAVNFDFADECINENFMIPFVVKAKNHSIFLEIFKNLDKSWQSKKFGFYSFCMSELYKLIHQMQIENSQNYIPKNKSAIIMPAIHYIHNNYMTGKIDISKLAKQCNISQTYFRRLFFLTYNVTPIQYINELKLKYASELLKTRMYTVSDIVDLCGFENDAYFSRAFKKRYGVCPTYFAKQNN